MSIEITGMSKTYKNGTVALDNVNLNITNGIFGLLGPNGAGKTTLLRILATVMGFDRGEVRINGLGLKTDLYAIRKTIGYLPQDFGLYPSITLVEFLDYICMLYEIKDRAKRKKMIDKAIEATDLAFAANKKLRTFSGGMKRRAGIAQCLINDPKIIIVDEPTAGLDPAQRVKLKNLLANLSKDKVVLFSTHIISDLENICSEIGILNKGTLLFNGSMEVLLDRVQESVWTGTCGLERIGSIEENYLVVKKSIVKDKWEYRAIGQNPPLPDAQRDQMAMEDAYMSLMLGQVGICCVEER